jgi:hypothetical protein
MSIEELLFALFVIREDCYALQQNKGYLAKKEPVTLELIRQHLAGTLTLGFYQLLKNIVKWGCCDFDKNTLEDFENAKLLFDYFVKQGFNPLFEMSGGGEYKCHIWLFSDTTATRMQAFLRGACNAIEIYPHEIFPKQVKVDEDGFGNLVKLPLGVHRKTGKRSYFLDSNFNEIKSQENVIKKLEEYM